MFVVPSISEIGARFIGKAECFYSVHQGIMVADESLCNTIARIVNRLLWLWEMRHNNKTRRLKPLLNKQSPSREGLKRGYSSRLW
ncbi:hypothetical protein [Microcoleus sp. D2_18a_D3]|uniref:hypothetical protein n=1 Tax=Microcoleus sp. D2_18a_D3 TaxID=3055330 RepID=UPI002FCFB4D5